MRIVSLFILVLCIPPAIPFYIPGVAPRNFQKGEDVEVKVIDCFEPQSIIVFVFSLKAVKMTSTKTQLPYDYYDLPIHCKPLNGTRYKSENLGKE